jgi:hypothetical protein
MQRLASIHVAARQVMARLTALLGSEYDAEVALAERTHRSNRDFREPHALNDQTHDIGAILAAHSALLDGEDGKVKVPRAIPASTG